VAVKRSPEDRPLKAREVADLLGLKPDAVKTIPASDLPYFRANARGDRRYTREDVERYIAARRVG